MAFVVTVRGSTDAKGEEKLLKALEKFVTEFDADVDFSGTTSTLKMTKESLESADAAAKAASDAQKAADKANADAAKAKKDNA